MDVFATPQNQILIKVTLFLPPSPSFPSTHHITSHQMSGEVEEIEECMLDAQNDSLLGVDFTTAEDGTKTFFFN